MNDTCQNLIITNMTFKGFNQKIKPKLFVIFEYYKILVTYRMSDHIFIL